MSLPTVTLPAPAQRRLGPDCTPIAQRLLRCSQRCLMSTPRSPTRSRTVAACGLAPRRRWLASRNHWTISRPMSGGPSHPLFSDGCTGQGSAEKLQGSHWARGDGQLPAGFSGCGHLKPPAASAGGLMSHATHASCGSPTPPTPRFHRRPRVWPPAARRSAKNYSPWGICLMIR